MKYIDTVSAAFFWRDIFYIETSFNFFSSKRNVFFIMLGMRTKNILKIYTSHNWKNKRIKRKNSIRFGQKVFKNEKKTVQFKPYIWHHYHPMRKVILKNEYTFKFVNQTC